jgi:hypothetical protein
MPLALQLQAPWPLAVACIGFVYANSSMRLSHFKKIFTGACIGCGRMSSRHNTYDRYGHGQQHQQHKRPRDDSERDARGGPRHSPDLRDALVRDSRRPNDYNPAASPSVPHFRPPYSPAASPSAPASRSSNAVDAVMAARGDAAVEWEILNGVLVKDENFKLVHIPVSLRPVPFPRSIFNSVWDIQALLQQL